MEEDSSSRMSWTEMKLPKMSMLNTAQLASAATFNCLRWKAEASLLRSQGQRLRPIEIPKYVTINGSSTLKIGSQNQKKEPSTTGTNLPSSSTS